MVRQVMGLRASGYRPAVTRDLALALLDALASSRGRVDYCGRKIWSRDNSKHGTVTGQSLCRLNGCGGLRLHVKWSDGRRTYPCCKGCDEYDNGELRII